MLLNGKESVAKRESETGKRKVCVSGQRQLSYMGQQTALF